MSVVLPAVTASVTSIAFCLAQVQGRVQRRAHSHFRPRSKVQTVASDRWLCIVAAQSCGRGHQDRSPLRAVRQSIRLLPCTMSDTRCESHSRAKLPDQACALCGGSCCHLEWKTLDWVGRRNAAAELQAVPRGGDESRAVVSHGGCGLGPDGARPSVRILFLGFRV